MINKYIKKPIEIEAVQFTKNNWKEIVKFTNKQANSLTINDNNLCQCIIPTLEGNHIASEGDYIIKGISGEFYPCKPDIFNATYTKVKE